MFYVLLRTRDLVEAMAEINPNSSGRLPKPEFRKALQKLGYTLLDSEYDKLWNRWASQRRDIWGQTDIQTYRQMFYWQN